MTREPAGPSRAVFGRPGGGEFVEILADQERGTLAQLSPLGERAVQGLTYASAKWTLKDVVGHLADDERIFAYRALCVARSDARALAGFAPGPDRKAPAS